MSDVGCPLVGLTRGTLPGAVPGSAGRCTAGVLPEAQSPPADPEGRTAALPDQIRPVNTALRPSRRRRHRDMATSDAPPSYDAAIGSENGQVPEKVGAVVLVTL